MSRQDIQHGRPADAAAAGRFEPIHLATLQVERCYAFDLYLPGEGGAGLYRAKHTPFTCQDRDRLLDNGVRFLQVAIADRAAYRAYLMGQLAALVADPGIALSKRCAAVTDCAETVSRELIRNPEQPQAVEDADALVRAVVDLVLREPKAIRNMVRMLKHDYYTYTHLVNVSTLAVGLALQMGIHDPQRLCRIGLGGLLHDIGKTRIDPEVLTIPSALNARQMTELRRHPEYGLLILNDVPTVTGDILRIVLEHHERLDGKGYPAGLVGGEISPDSQICAVADIFDGMTCTRPYREALDVQFTLDYLGAQRGGRLDPKPVNAWLAMAEAWPADGTDFIDDARVLAVGMGTGDGAGGQGAGP